MVVSLGCCLVFKVTVVTTYQFDTILFCHFYEHLVCLLLKWEGFTIGKNRRIGNLVALKLQVIIIAKHTMIPFASLASSLDIAIKNLGWHLTSYTSRAHNKVFVIFLKIVAVGTRTGVETVNPRIRNKLDKVFIAIIVFCKNNKVITNIITLAFILTLLMIVCHIHLATDNRFEWL